MQQAHARRFLSTTLCAAALLVVHMPPGAAQTPAANQAGLVSNASPVVPVPHALTAERQARNLSAWLARYSSR